MRLPRPASLAVAVVLALGGSTLPAVGLLQAGAAAAAPARRIVHTDWSGRTGFAEGRAEGVGFVNGRLRLDAPSAARGGYTYGRWTSPWVRPGFDLTELVPSWRAETPGHTWIEVQVRGRVGAQRSSWDTVAQWSAGDRRFRRTSPDAQDDDLGRTSYDTWITSAARAWRIRVLLFRKTGTRGTPRVAEIGAMVSRLPDASGVATSRPGVAAAAGGITLAVPSYSQMTHRGAYREYDGGGEAWCSPTSTTMVLGYYRALPDAQELAWVANGHPDPEVVHAARMTYDARLGGTGNWPFNTAYAAGRTGQGFVTRLRSLREAERFIAAGIPLVVSLTFGRGELSGAPLSSTPGHLLVVAGFTRDGDVVVNDPAAATRGGVRRVYDRGQFEDAWLKRYAAAGSLRGSGGLTYVIRDRAHRLPARNGNRNW